MKPITSPAEVDFELLLSEHLRLIELANDLEYHLYQLGQASLPEPAAACQQAAGALLGTLRSYLFRQDQQVLPIVEAYCSRRD